MRKQLLVNWEDELYLMNRLKKELLDKGLDSSNTVVVTVSSDYSAVVGQYLRHQLTINGEICDGFAIDVPYPDESWDEIYEYELEELLSLYSYKLVGKKILFVEAGVIRGGNYYFISNFIEEYLGIVDDVFYLTLFENIGSKFKSDFVGEYYDDKTQDLTFWWEKQNNHWK